jgi:hypothetical protein
MMYECEMSLLTRGERTSCKTWWVGLEASTLSSVVTLPLAFCSEILQEVPVIFKIPLR